MDIFIEQILNGLILGSQYAIVAVGLALIFGVVGIVNFAHGEFFMAGAYAFFLFYSGENLSGYLLAVLAAIALMFFLGMAYERMVIDRIINRSWHSQIVATLATSIILINLGMLLFGTTPKVTPTILAKTTVRLALIDINISYQRISIFLVTALVFIALNLFLQKTKLGKAMRAISQNREASEIYGIEIRKISAITFGIGAGLAALAAGFMSPLFNILPTMGVLLTLKAFAAVIMGGFGNVRGAIYAAYLIGVTEALAIGYGYHLNIETAYKDAFAYGIMILVLLLRPQGLFGKKVGI